MTGVQEQVKVEMAIPMGGEEQMDTSHYPVMEGSVDKEPGGFVTEESGGVIDERPGGVVDEGPGGIVTEEPVVNSYVSIKLKGAGRPIHIRGDEPQLAKTQVISIAETDAYRPETHKHQFDAGIREISDNKPGFSHQYRVSSNESNKKNSKAVPVDLATGREESISDPQSSFTAQTGVVSIQSSIPGDVSQLNSDSRSSPGKVTRKKKTSSRKNKHGKQSAPYPEPLKQLLSSMQSGKRHYVEHNGMKHLVQINLIPVQEDTELEASEESIVVHKPRIVDENAGGSVDRPPDSGYEHMDMVDTDTSGNHPQMSASIDHYGYDRYDQMVDHSAYPLDLSEKPLDLTVKRKYPDSTIFQGQRYSVENSASVVNSLPTYDEENTDSFPPSDESSMSTEVKDDVGKEHEYRDTAGSSLGFDDASSCYEDNGGRASVQSEDQSLGYGDCNPHVNSKPVEASGDTDRGDGNLPSLSGLTLNSENLEGHPLVSLEVKNFVASQRVDMKSVVMQAVEEQTVGKPSQNNIGGQDGIVWKYQRGLITAEQLLYVINQTVTAMNKNASAKVLGAKVVAEVPSQSRACENLQTSEQNDVSNIPVPAMPNFFSLEVANDSGELLVKEGEKVKNNLREKLRKKLPNGRQ